MILPKVGHFIVFCHQAAFMSSSCVRECAYIADEATVAAAAEDTIGLDTPSAFWTVMRLGAMRAALVRAMRARIRARNSLSEGGAAGATSEGALPRVAYLSAQGREVDVALAATDAAHADQMVTVLNLDDEFCDALEEA